MVQGLGIRWGSYDRIVMGFYKAIAVSGSDRLARWLVGASVVVGSDRLGFGLFSASRLRHEWGGGGG